MIKPFFELVWAASPGLTLVSCFAVLIRSVFPLLVLYIGKLLVDELVLQVGQEIPELDHFYSLLVILAVVSISQFIINRINQVTRQLLGDLFQYKTSASLIERAAMLDLEFFEDNEFYDKLERARKQSYGRVLLLYAFLDLLTTVITMTVLAVALLFFNPFFFLVIILAAIPAAVSERYFSKLQYRFHKQWTPVRRQMWYHYFLGTDHDYAKEIKVFGLSGFLRSEYEQLTGDYFQAWKKLIVRRASWNVVMNMFITISLYGGYVILAVQAINGVITVGTLTFWIGALVKVGMDVRGLMSGLVDSEERLTYLQDFFDFFRIQPKIFENEDGLPWPEKLVQGIEFRNVSYRYNKSDVWALKGVSFRISPSEKMALVGENGAGKTTLIRLLCRLYDPTGGQILLEGVDLKEYRLSEVRKNIGVIFQDFVRFSMQAKTNIAVGNIEQRDNMARIEESAEKSLAASVIESLPKGYEQMLGKRFDKGYDLSGGQWQKIAIARAFMNDADVLILDEPTSALDARAEQEVFERFTTLTEGKLSVVISHRFSTVRMAERILVLERGEVIEFGTHYELMQQDGQYAELFNLQAAGYQ